MFALCIFSAESADTRAWDEASSSAKWQHVTTRTTDKPIAADEAAERALAVLKKEQPIRCGANSLYILLRLQGTNLDYASVLKLFTPRVDGHSLLELRDAAKHLGFSSTIEKYRPEQLPSVPLPVIAHMDGGRSDVGHFVVLLTADRNNVTYIDGTTGVQSTVDRNYYDAKATGHFLRLKQSGGWDNRLHIATVVIMLAMGMGLIRYVFF